MLGDARPDADALTRGQQKKITEITSEKPSPKKVRIAKDNTMVGTAKVLGYALIYHMDPLVLIF